MFGRSGQMFPRRTFHDAIYEEEYGSDNEDECCRCRGLSAILCWFLSVIILVGLAATVVLTVFFILRSRSMMVKPNADVDVEMYGKDQNLYDSGGTSKEMIGSNESFVQTEIGKLKKGGKSGKGPDTTKNDVDANVNEEQNAILDSVQVDQAEDASVSHPRNHNTNNRHNRLQPYSTTTTTSTESPVPSEEEEEEESSEEIENNDQNNEEGSSLFNLFSGPRNPSYNTPLNQDEDEFVSKESTIRHGHHGLISAESSETRYRDGSPVQQVLFTESPKVTVTTPNPYNNRRNLQTTRFPTGRTSFSTTTTTMAPPEESNEEDENNADHNDNDDKEHATINNKHDNDEDEGGDDNDEDDDDDQAEDNQTNEKTIHETDEINDEEKPVGSKDVHEESSEEVVAADAIEINKTESSTQATTTTSAYDAISEEESESEMGSQSGESQLKQMLLDEIPPHKKGEEQILSSEDVDGNVSSSQEFNLEQAVTLTTTARPPTTTKTTKLLKTRQNTLTRIISRNFTRQGTTSTTTSEVAVSATTESSIGTPSVTTLGPAGHKYDYTMTPYERTKMKVKSVESTEQEVVVTKPPPKSRYRSTTPKSAVAVTPEPPSTAAPRTRGTTTPSTSDEYGVKLGGQRGSVESPIDIVPSPDLSPKGQQTNSPEGADLASASSEESKTSEQFLDVLVGSEDHKTLVTKKTDDGIVTSAILPPWYDTNGPINSSISEVLATNGTTISNTVAKVEDEEGSVVASNFGERTNPLKSSEEKQQSLIVEKSMSKEEGGSEFERLVNIFSKQQSSSEEVPQRFGYKKVKQVVVKKTVPGLLSQGSRYIPQVPGRANLYPGLNNDESETSKESSNPTASSEKKSSTASWVSENDQMGGPGNSEHSGDVSRTGVLPTSEVEPEDMPTGYYPEEDPVNSDKIVEQHLVESERLSSDEMADSMMESVPPSHVIDVNFEEADNPQEIIIEQDSSAPVEDGDFEGDDYAYGEHPPTMSMAGSTPNQHVVAAPEEFVRGSGIRKPVSSEEEETENDLEGSGSSPVENNNSTTTTTTTSSPVQVTPSVPPVAIRRPAYTREEIAKSVVKPSPESLAVVVDSANNLQAEHDGAAEATVSDEFEEYEDDNYEDGSVEHQGAGSSVEQWSIEKTDGGQKWSAPDKILDGAPNSPQQYASEEFEEHQSVETQKQVDITKNTVDNTAPGNDSTSQIETTSDNSTSSIFKPPALVSFHENKLSFSPPVQAEEEYHSKDGWRPVISGPAHNNNPPPSDSPTDPYYNAGGSQEPDSGQIGSFESEQTEGGEPQQQHESQFQELPSPQQQLQQEPKQQWPTTGGGAAAAAVELNGPLEAQGNGKLKPSPMIPPPIPANVKFPDSEEDHEDRHHHVRHKPRQPLPINNFDRAKYMVRPVPPPIVMRRHPHSTGPYPPPPVPHNRQPPPPRPQMIPQASQPNPQFSEHPQVRPPLPPHINRNFHMRPNMPMRRFNFGPPQAQPRSGGNIKWPSENKDSSNENSKNISEQNIEKIASQSEIATNSRRRRRRGIA